MLICKPNGSRREHSCANTSAKRPGVNVKKNTTDKYTERLQVCCSLVLFYFWTSFIIGSNSPYWSHRKAADEVLLPGTSKMWRASKQAKPRRTIWTSFSRSLTASGFLSGFHEILSMRCVWTCSNFMTEIYCCFYPQLKKHINEQTNDQLSKTNGQGSSHEPQDANRLEASRSTHVPPDISWRSNIRCLAITRLPALWFERTSWSYPSTSSLKKKKNVINYLKKNHINIL